MEILIAEDDESILEMLANILDSLGHTLLTAREGQEAWHIFQTKFVPMVITDWLMPQMDGLELCRNIREASRDHYTYIIVATETEQKKALLKSLKCGVDDFILKPFDVNELSTRINASERIINLEKSHWNLQRILIESRNKLRIVVDSLRE
jgi:DNA-binding response OmpR family regulator